MAKGSSMDESKDDLRKEVIKHLSSEIGKQSDYVVTLRSRMAFTILLGPFVVVGSVLIAIKGPLHFHPLHGFSNYFAIGMAALSYLCMAYYRSEEHTSALQSRQYLVCRLL